MAAASNAAWSQPPGSRPPSFGPSLGCKECSLRPRPRDTVARTLTLLRGPGPKPRRPLESGSVRPSRGPSLLAVAMVMPRLGPPGRLVPRPQGPVFRVPASPSCELQDRVRVSGRAWWGRDAWALVRARLGHARPPKEGLSTHLPQGFIFQSLAFRFTQEDSSSSLRGCSHVTPPGPSPSLSPNRSSLFS